MTNYESTCGDVGFLGYDGGILPAAINFFTTAKGERKSKASHQFQFLFYGEVVEALSRGVIVRRWEERLQEAKDSKAHFIVFRPPTTSAQQERIHKAGMSIRGKRYGFVEIGLQAIDGAFQRWGFLKNGRPFFSRLGTVNPRTMICSRAGNYCLYHAGILPKIAMSWSPDDTFDEAIRRGWQVAAIDEQGAGFWRLPKQKE